MKEITFFSLLLYNLVFILIIISTQMTDTTTTVIIMKIVKSHNIVHFISSFFYLLDYYNIRLSICSQYLCTTSDISQCFMFAGIEVQGSLNQ